MDKSQTCNGIPCPSSDNQQEPSSPCSPGGDVRAANERDYVVINVGGQRHETLRHTLDRHYCSRLSDLDELSPHYRKAKDEYFFDRHPGMFAAILNYYRTGELHIPEDFCSPSVKNELDYWKINEEEIEQCCWIRYKSQEAVRKSLRSFETAITNSAVVDLHALTTWQRIRKRMWDVLEYPKTSKIAKVYAVFSFLVTMLSITVFCCETHPNFRQNMSAAHYAEVYGVKPFEVLEEWYEYYDDTSDWEPGWIEDWERQYGKDWHEQWPPNAKHNEPGAPAGPPPSPGTASPDDGTDDPTSPHPKSRAKYRRDAMMAPPDHTLELIDNICMGYFCIELLVRFVACPSKRRFFLEPLNFIDLISILPFFIERVVNEVNKHERYKQSVVDALFILKVLRIFRIFRLVRHHRGLRVLVHTIRASWRELLLLIIFLLIGMVLFASLVYYADHGQGNFQSIPHAFWWAVVTMTTLGYGDMVPKSDLGYLVGAVCAVTGVLVIAFTVPSIVNNFLMFYRDVQYEKTERRQRPTLAKLYKAKNTGSIEKEVVHTPVTPIDQEGCIFTVEENGKSKT